MDRDERGMTVDRLLRRVRRAEPRGPETDACLDADMLAAFADGSLPRAERAAAEAHAAGCARCLQLLAAMVRTEELAPRRRLWHLPAVWRWAVPLAAAATALALWVNVAEDLRETPAPPAGPIRPPTVSASPTTSAGSERLQSNTQADRAKARESAEARTPEAKRPDLDSTAKGILQPRSSAAGNRQTVSRGSEDDERRERKEALAPPEAPAAAPTAPPAAVAERPLEQFRDSSARSVAARRAFTSVEIVSPDPLHRWRATGLVVQRSIDGGNTWSTAVVRTQGEVLAGSSPLPNVCWLVGRQGAVLLTTDGLQWRRLDFPESIDLTAVRARNEREAELTTADGRVFGTSDGGGTWSLKEFPGSSF